MIEFVQLGLFTHATRHRGLVGTDLDPAWFDCRLSGLPRVAGVFAVAFVVAWIGPAAVLLTLSLVRVVEAPGSPTRLFHVRRRPKRPTPG